MKLRHMTAIGFLEEIEYFVKVEFIVFNEGTTEDSLNIITLEHKTSSYYDRDIVVCLLNGLEVTKGRILRSDIHLDDYAELESIFPELPDFSWIGSVKFGHRSLSEVKWL